MQGLVRKLLKVFYGTAYPKVDAAQNKCAAGLVT
jgi:hypothetical protein